MNGDQMFNTIYSIGEKTLIKCIKLDEEHYLEFRLEYNYKNQISLHISKFYHKQGEDYTSTSGLGKRKLLKETEAKRKTVDALIEYTKQLSNNTLMEINSKTTVSSGNGIIIASEDFQNYE